MHEEIKKNYKYLPDEERKVYRTVDYHLTWGERWKSVYEATKDKRGFDWINRYAYRSNRIHCLQASRLLVGEHRKLAYKLDCINDLLKKQGSDL